MRGIPVGGKKWLFVGSKKGGQAAAVAYALIESAKLTKIDPEVRLSDVMSRIGEHRINRIDEVLPRRYHERQVA